MLPHTPVAALLSGGLDSSVLAFELSRHASQKPTCFAGVVCDEVYDESPYAVEVAKSLELSHVLVRLPGATSLDVVKRLTALRGHPVGMHNEAAMHLLARAVSHSHKVLLTGERADEIFLGYSRIFRLPFDLRRQTLLAALPDVIGRPARRYLGLPKVRAREFELFLARYTYFPQSEKLALATSAWRKEIVHDAGLIDWMNNAYHSSGANPGEHIRHFFVQHHLPALLGMVDNTTMAAGVEARVPFTDHRMVTLALSMSLSEHLHWKHPFAPLRAAFIPIEKFSETLDVSKAAPPTSIVDLVATILSILRLPLPSTVHGRIIDEALQDREASGQYDVEDASASIASSARRSTVFRELYRQRLYLRGAAVTWLAQAKNDKPGANPRN
ncbi:asparagine synthase C-terminal domain-containing protein [Bradyrhizobium sp. C-145]|uniref:asparagine synthase-related protein n=1 Tax=Bradyrhizobium sp. C-145 TaxID=574727 RepID=UPI00201B6E3F|nr:asparagine synthase C-terminal domain-containing protein [Bradyrhizobium sp. C-145]UQR61429.1 asparagine synthase C-terminal domain-containing protein [Bradyrhizobium sp. C-145]